MTKEDMVILIEIADATRKITEFFMGSDDMKGNSKGFCRHWIRCMMSFLTM